MRVCSQFSVVLRARYQSWGCGPCQDTFIDVCTRKCVYMCVAKACQWPIRGKIETPLGTDSLNQHNLLGFTIRPGDSSIACWHTNPAPAAPQTADYLLNSLQLQRCELTPLSIPLCHTHGLIFSDRFPCYFSVYSLDFMLGCWDNWEVTLTLKGKAFLEKHNYTNNPEEVLEIIRYVLSLEASGQHSNR